MKTGDQRRPVCVSMRNVPAARLILSKASKLRQTEKFKAVYISPDRTPEQRIEHRELVAELKRRRVDEPAKRHFIRGGNVETV